MATFLDGILGQGERDESVERERSRAEIAGEALRKLTDALERQLAPGGGGRLRPRREVGTSTHEDLLVRDFFSTSRRVQAAAMANRNKVSTPEVEVLKRADRIYNGTEKLGWTQVAARLLEETTGDERAVAHAIYGGPDQQEAGDPGDRLRKRVERARKTGLLPPTRRQR